MDHGLLAVRLAHRVDTTRYVVSANSVGVEETEVMNRAFFENFTRFEGGCTECGAVLLCWVSDTDWRVSVTGC